MERRKAIRNKLRWVYVAMDFATTLVAFLLFDIFRYYFNPEICNNYSLGFFLAAPKVLAEQFLIPASLLGVYWLSGYYNIPEEKSRLQEFLTTLSTAVFNALLIFLTLLLNDRLGRRRFDYEMILMLAAIFFVCTYTGRLVLTNLVAKHFGHRNKKFRTVLAGQREQIRKMEQRLERTRHDESYVVSGYFPLDIHNNPEEPKSEKDLDYESLRKEIANGEIDQIILAMRPNDEKSAMKALGLLFPLNVPIRIAPDALWMTTSSVRLGNVLGEPFVDLASPPLSECSKNIKRSFDVVASVVALFITSPLLLYVAYRVKTTSKGPVFYRQERIGRHSKPFSIIKFRTMRIDAEQGEPRLSSDNDPRITSTGRWLRKYRIDEFPQFWNVIKGDMSLVGPRPERQYYIDRIEKRMPQYTLLHQVRPGITSLGMVKYGYASSVEGMMERARFDLVYIANMSIAMDLKIMIYTIQTIVGGKGK